MLAALSAIQAGHGRRALVLLSDGADRYSLASAADVIQQARSSDVLVYPVALARERPPLFAELAAVTGGRSFQAADVEDAAVNALHHRAGAAFAVSAGIRTVAADIGTPGLAFDCVTVHRPDVHVRARAGYLARRIWSLDYLVI